MSVVNLTFTASETELTSGVPTSVTIECNVPATIYYTIDGDTPTTDSTIYIEAIETPTNLTSLTLSAFAVDGDGNESSILTQVFAADQTLITVGRHVGNEGVRVDDYSEQTNTVAGYDADGAAGTFIDVTEQFVYSNSVHSDRGAPGDREGTKVIVNIPDPTDTPNPLDDQIVPTSSTRYAATFNPYAKVINIDNTAENEVNPVLRPHGSFENVYREQGGVRLRNTSEACYISGGFTRRFYNRAEGTMTSYYYDANESRWITNKQAMPTNIQSTAGVYQATEHPFVYRWIPRGKQSSNMV